MFCMNLDFNAHKSSLHKRCLLIKWVNVGVCSSVWAQKSFAVSLLRHMDVCVLPRQPACIRNICIRAGSKEGTNWISNDKDFSFSKLAKLFKAMWRLSLAVLSAEEEENPEAAQQSQTKTWHKHNIRSVAQIPQLQCLNSCAKTNNESNPT